MNQEIEIEFKNLLNATEYARLKTDFFGADASGFKQTNTYFDTTDEALRRSACALRIRVKKDEAEITLKTPFKGHHKEWNLPLNHSEAIKTINASIFELPPSLTSFIREELELEITQVKKIAELTTERLERPYENCLLVLDRSWYSNTTDYELELESPSIETGNTVFNSLLHTYGIPVRKTPNKIKRAVSAHLNG
ncbi:Adenylate cyclase [Alkalibacterium sp. AK22]|uniref:CYTH domain-containing protein n=1 Tax=Alkalibacterium sp. AK22 TaxID=1229520 RepID=UPI00044B085E|nr:CYTH domain-containing protein [Alkalibacterium sp. AK22]EXJ22884.1 Adenylate cyclase [Alkalibacterium sp. AK22]